MCHALDAKVGNWHIYSALWPRQASAALDTVFQRMHTHVGIPQRMLDDQMFHGALIMSRPCLDIRDGVPPAAM